MPKIDPNGEVPNPIKAKLAHDIATPTLNRKGKPINPPQIELPKEEQRLFPTPGRKSKAKLSKAKKVLFTLDEQKENDLAVSLISEAVGADTLSWSHVDRALWSLLRHVQDQIKLHAEDAPQLTRPPNGNPIEVAHFEDRLAEFLLTLLKNSPRLSVI